MPDVLDVTVPSGSGPGDTVDFADASGTQCSVVVPVGLAEGDTFQVEVDEGIATALQDGEPQSTIMQHFVEWFERESVGDQVDKFVIDNAAAMAALGHIEPGGEHSHEWWPMYQRYQQQFEALLQSFLGEAGCTGDEFLAAANAAEGMDQIYVKLFLAHSEYTMFVELMSMEALKQAAENELGG